MHQVNCTHCGRIVQISPDAPRCAVCGQDLHTLIPEGYTAPYFYHRAADLAARGDLPSALAEVERGLAYLESSELRLLAAILAKRLNDRDSVRIHVAAIPVDDRLRQEAEWLLRSQTETRPQETLAPASTVYAQDKSQLATVSENLPATPSPLEGATLSVAASGAASGPASAQPLAAQASASSPRSGATVWAQRVWGVVALVLILIAGAMGWTLLSGGPDALIALLPGLSEAAPSAVVQEPRALEAVTPMPLVLPTPTPNGAPAAAQQIDTAAFEPAQSAAPVMPTATAAPTVPADFVQAPASEAVAASGIASAAGLAPATLDLPALLVNAGRADLAALDLRAAIEGNNVRLSGILTSTADRTAIIDLLEAIPAVEEISAVDLLVRIPTTYTVQAGDSLWGIVSKFYGPDADRLTQLVELNSDSLAGGQTLQVDDVLQLPPLD